MINSKATIDQQRHDFPKLMVNKHGQVVMFENRKKGVLIHNGRLLNCTIFIGESYDNWDFSEFKCFYGTVELSNSDD